VRVVTSLWVAFVSPLDLIGVLGAGGYGRFWWAACPVVHGPAGIRAAVWRKSAASGQAAAKARRTREAVSIDMLGRAGVNEAHIEPLLLEADELDIRADMPIMFRGDNYRRAAGRLLSLASI
jgi:hypothetical protein